MRHGAHARRHLVLVRFNPGDQFLQVLGGDGVVGDDDQRVGGKQRNRFEILQQVVGQGVGGAVQDMSRPLADTQRIAVGCGARHAADSDRAVRSADVLNDDALAERR